MRIIADKFYPYRDLTYAQPGGVQRNCIPAFCILHYAFIKGWFIFVK